MEALKKSLVWMLLCLCSTGTFGQSFKRAGLVSTQLTISPALSLSQSSNSFYLHGGLEVFASEKVSFEGSAYISLGSIHSDFSTFEFNHSLFWGGNYHFTQGNHDLYLGLQPGLSFTKVAESAFSTGPYVTGVNPLLSAAAGYQFFFFKFMHFFAQTRLVLGQHRFDFVRDLSELRISAGLGFNLNALKPR